MKPRIETIKNVFIANVLKVANLDEQSAKVKKTKAGLNKDTNVDKTVASDTVVGNWWPNDDDVETYLTGDMNGNKKYYAFMSIAKWLKLDYSGPDRDPSYNPKWECKSTLYKDGWKTIQVIPFRSMEVNINATRQLKAQFFRTYHINGEGNYCGWLGGSVWSYLDMKLLQLVD